MALRKITVFTLMLGLLLSFAGPGFADGGEDTGCPLEEALAGIVAYYENNKTGLTSWREAVGLKRAGQDIGQPPWVLPDWQIDQLSAGSQPTDYAGTILALLADEEDPQDVEGRNLVEELAAGQEDDGSFGSGLNWTIWSVIALDEAIAQAGGSYGGCYDPGQATAYLLSQQKGDGGWALSGEQGDPDITGDALIALARHRDVDGVADAIGRALAYLKNSQLPGGGFGGGNKGTPESVVAVIRGLLACGEDPTAAGWREQDGNMVDALFAFQMENGSFVHALSETTPDAMATAQALQAAADLVHAGVSYNVIPGKIPVGAGEAEVTVRVRAEGVAGGLADKTVTLPGGTALEALKAAVGEENVVLDTYGLIAEIMGESGEQLPGNVSTSWMYYVVRSGAVEPGAFASGAGGYNVREGDEVIFYIGAMDDTWAPQTFFPAVTLAPETPRAGGQVTLTVETWKNEWTEDWQPKITPVEIQAIGEYTVEAGNARCTTQDGRVTFPVLEAGTLSLIITNQNEAGYPDVVPYRGVIRVGAATSGGGGDSPPPAGTAGVAIVGRNGAMIFGPATVSVPAAGRWGFTPLGALDAAGVPYVISGEFDGFIDAIAGQSCGGLEGWMYTVNDTSPMVAAKDYNLAGGDRVIWYYSTSIEQAAPTWAQLTSGSVTGSPAPPVPVAYVTNTSGSALLNPAAGGNVGLGKEVSLEIPAGALGGTAGMEVGIQRAGDPPAAPEGFSLLGSVFEFTISDEANYVFNRPVTLTFSFAPAALPPGAVPAVYYYDEVTLTWVKLGGDVSGNTITVSLEHFTKFAVFVKAPLPVKEQVFTDVRASFWAAQAINMLHGLGYISGYPDGTFRPDGWITRAEFVSILDKIPALVKAGPGVPGFTDVTPADWFYTAVQNVARAGVISGYGNNLFKPHNPVTREEVAAMLVNAGGQPGEAAAGMHKETGFTDDLSISAWAKGAVAVAAEAGLMPGYPDKSFQPQGRTTRAEACTIAAHLLNFNTPRP